MISSDNDGMNELESYREMIAYKFTSSCRISCSRSSSSRISLSLTAVSCACRRVPSACPSSSTSESDLGPEKGT